MITPDQVSVCLVTMGDVDLRLLTNHMPPEFEIVVWDNSRRPQDWKVFGRYMAIEEASRPVIAFLDDDAYLTRDQWDVLLAEYEPGVVTGNLIHDDPVWRKRYFDTTLLGWGAVFDRNLPAIAFEKYSRYYPLDWEFKTSPGGAEVVFPMLSRCKTVVAGATWLGDPGAEVFGRSNRMSNQPGFLETRLAWLARARDVRDRIARDAA